MADLDVSVENGIATLTMNRPEARNALSDTMKKLLTDALHDIEYDDSVRCVVLTGEGDHFMAGGDVKGMFETFKQTPAEIEKAYNLRIHDLHTIMYPIRRMGKPVVASVRGAAAGAGVSFALMCDLVICSEDAFFTLAYCNIGTSPDGSSTFQLPRTMGMKKAMEMTLLGDRYASAQALEMGLVNFVVPNDELKAETDKLTTRLANGPTYVYGRAKKLLYQSNETQWESQLQAEAESFAACAARADFKEGVTAFVEKRKPNFTGK